MGQKTNPIGNRLGIIRGWESNWYGGNDYGDKLAEDDKIRKYVHTRLAKASVSRVIIERTLKLVTVTITTSRPGSIIGKGGQEVDKLREELKKITGKDIQINIFEIKRPELDAPLVAASIARQIENRISYRRAIKMAIAATMRMNAEGIKIQISGRLNGAEMARKVLKDNLDLDIKYYALGDFQAFATAIDTLFPDGVTIDAQFSTLNGVPVTEATVGDDLHATETESPTQTIKVGKQQMNGSTLLNYARFRDDDEGDYGRTKRQQQVMSAVLEQIKDPTKLFTGSEALGKVFGMTSTNLPYSFLLTNGLSVLEGAQNGIERLTVPELGDWVDAYDIYGGQGLLVDQNKYQTKLAQMGMR